MAMKERKSKKPSKIDAPLAPLLNVVMSFGELLALKKGLRNS